MHPAMWIRCIEEDLAAGAHYTITEARESGTGGICRADGELRFGLIEEIVDSGLDLDRLVFEAPNQALQTYFVKRMGANVNLANVPLGQVVSLETLRLGLRSDTLLWSEGAEGAWGPEVVRVGGDRDEE
jgi:phosphosulfolactate synthase